MKAFRIVVLTFFVLLAVQQVYAGVSAITSPVMKLLDQARRAESSGRTEIAEEKYEQILAKDPDHYQALVSLAQIALKKAGDRLDARVIAKCEYYLLRAAVNQPHRPEAYLVLAQLKYQMGEINEGDLYAKWAKDREPASREAYALLGQRYENSGNYVAATKEYQSALDNLPYDPYFLSRRYWAASNITTSQWVSEFVPYWQVVHVFDQFAPFLAPLLNYNPDAVRWVIYELLRISLVADFRQEAGRGAELPEQYSLPEFNFGYCRLRERRPNDYADLYEAFLKASVKDGKEYQRLREKLKTMKKEALKAVEKYDDPKEKAKALYMWLKTKWLKNYSIEEGILAEQVLDDQKYLCLSGAILYALIARDANLPAYGMITPGHAYALLDFKDREIPVELTAEPMFNLTREEGFDINWWNQFAALNRVNAYGGLKGGTSSRNIGKITPEELTAYQFLNVFHRKRKKILDQFKDEMELIDTLKLERRDKIVELGRRIQEIDRMTDKDAGQVAELRTATIERYENAIVEVQDRIAEVELRIMKQMTDFEYDQGKELVQNALSLSPFTEEFSSIAEEIYIRKALANVLPLVESIKKRDRKRKKLELERRAASRSMTQPGDTAKDAEKKATKKDVKKESTDSYQAQTERIASAERKLDRIKIQEKEDWANDKKIWMQAIKLMEEGLDSFPCSQRLKRTLENFCNRVVMLARLNDDHETRAEVVEIGTKRFPEARFVKEFYEAAAE